MIRHESGLHEFDAFNMGEAGHVVKVGWIGMGTYLLMNLKGCPAAKLPSVEYVCGGNGSKSLESFGQGFCLVLALAVSASVEISGDVHVPFHNGSRWGC